MNDETLRSCPNNRRWPYLLRRNEPEQSPVQVDLLLQFLRRKEGPRPGLHGREGDVEDGALHVGVVLDVEDEDGLAPGGEDGRHAVHEEAEQGRQEALLRHVLQAHRDAVGEHVVGDDGHAECAEGRGGVDAIWGGGTKK